MCCGIWGFYSPVGEYYSIFGYDILKQIPFTVSTVISAGYTYDGARKFLQNIGKK